MKAEPNCLLSGRFLTGSFRQDLPLPEKSLCWKPRSLKQSSTPCFWARAPHLVYICPLARRRKDPSDTQSAPPEGLCSPEEGLPATKALASPPPLVTYLLDFSSAHKMRGEIK